MHFLDNGLVQALVHRYFLQSLVNIGTKQSLKLMLRGQCAKGQNTYKHFLLKKIPVYKWTSPVFELLFKTVKL